MQGEEEEHGGKEGQTMGKKNRQGRRRHQGERGIGEGRIRATGILGYREERGGLLASVGWHTHSGGAASPKHRA